MRITNAIELAAPADEVFVALLDFERVATAVPGVELDRVEGDVCLGAVVLQVGPVNARYEGQVELVDADRETGRVVIRASGGETRGRGRVAATITASIRSADRGSAVDLVTELDIRGRLAQVGHVALAGVSQRMLGEFARNLERDLGAVVVDDRPTPTAGASLRPSAALAPKLWVAGAAGAGVLLAVALARRLWGRTG